MKTIFLFAILCVYILFACTHKAAPIIPERKIEPITGNKPDTADLSSSNPLIAGKAIYRIKCTKCHNEKPVSNWTAEQWKPILALMVKKAKLNEAEILNVTSYVNQYAKK